MLHRILLFTLLLFLIRHSSAQENDTLHYLFLGHPKLSQAGVLDIDPRVKGIEMEYYDRVWLGGDITGESNLNYSTLEYIDSLFDVSNPSNHWAFGNHDQRNYNTEWLREITQKNTFHTHF